MQERIRPATEFLRHVSSQIHGRGITQCIMQAGRLEPSAFFIVRDAGLIRPRADEHSYARNVRAARGRDNCPLRQLEISVH